LNKVESNGRGRKVLDLKSLSLSFPVPQEQRDIKT